MSGISPDATNSNPEASSSSASRDLGSPASVPEFVAALAGGPLGGTILVSPAGVRYLVTSPEKWNDEQKTAGFAFMETFEVESSDASDASSTDESAMVVSKDEAEDFDPFFKDIFKVLSVQKEVKPLVVRPSFEEKLLQPGEGIPTYDQALCTISEDPLRSFIGSAGRSQLLLSFITLTEAHKIVQSATSSTAASRDTFQTRLTEAYKAVKPFEDEEAATRAEIAADEKTIRDLTEANEKRRAQLKRIAAERGHLDDTINSAAHLFDEASKMHSEAVRTDDALQLIGRLTRDLNAKNQKLPYRSKSKKELADIFNVKHGSDILRNHRQPSLAIPVMANALEVFGAIENPNTVLRLVNCRENAPGGVQMQMDSICEALGVPTVSVPGAKKKKAEATIFTSRKKQRTKGLRSGRDISWFYPTPAAAAPAATGSDGEPAAYRIGSNTAPRSTGSHCKFPSLEVLPSW